MTLKEFILQKSAEIRQINDELDIEYRNISSIDSIRDYAKNNGRFEVINELMRFMLDNNI